MKTYKKYIFDIDYTILIPDWSQEDDYFRTIIKEEEQEEFFKQKQAILTKYEQSFPKYDLKALSQYFRVYGFTLSEDDIFGWMCHNSINIKDTVVDGVVDLFSYLKEHDKRIVILTSWFGITQIERLKRSGLYPYVDLVITGDVAMKPHIDAFNLAIGNTPKDECIMIGDNIRSDKMGADNVGIDSYIVNESNTIRDFYNMVKNPKPFVRTEK